VFPKKKFKSKVEPGWTRPNIASGQAKGLAKSN